MAVVEQVAGGEAARLRAELTATQDLVRLMAGDADLQTVLERVTVLAGRLIGTGRAALHLLDGDLLKLKASVIMAGQGGDAAGLADGRLWLTSNEAGMVRRRPVDAPDEPWQVMPVSAMEPHHIRSIQGEPLTATWVPGRAALERHTVTLSDLFGPEGDSFPATRALVTAIRAQGRPAFEALAATPLLRAGQLLGVLTAMNGAPRQFTPDELALLETFAAHAALAIENARLFADLQERLEEQTATGRVLEVISRSPTDLQTILDTIAESAARLCGNEQALIALAQGGWTRIVASVGPSPRTGRRYSLAEPGEPRQISRAVNAYCRAILDREVVHIVDLAAVPVEELVTRNSRSTGVRTQMAVPLLRAADSLGAILLSRREVQPFTERQIALVQTFADQAVIAIENARLFQELNDTNATLQESLDQQTATAEVLRAIAASPTELGVVLDTIATTASRLTGPHALGCRIFRLVGDELQNVARYSAAASALGSLSPARRLEPGWAAAHAIWERRQLHLADAQTADAEYPVSAADARRGGHHTLLLTPLLREGEPIGLLSTGRVRVEPFSEAEMRLVQTFADQAVIAIENTRLFTELNETNATLKESLEQQTATAEVLQAISRSPADLEPVLEQIVATATRLVGADHGTVVRTEGQRIVEGMSQTGQATPGVAQSILGAQLSRGSTIGRAVIDKRTIHLPDVLEEGGEFPTAHRVHESDGSRAFLVAPLLRGDEVIGAIHVRRQQPGAFSDPQIKLLESFADQAVIAIENARLFRELEERDERRRQELERASAIQQRLLPAEVAGWPGILELAVRFRPAVETSGDFYDVLRLTPAAEGALPPLQIAVGDVAGKGMSAALVTALARAALHASASVPTGLATPATTLRLAGQRLHRDVGSSHFVACALAVVEPPGVLHAGPRLRLSNAAQVPVLLVRDAGTPGPEVREIEAPGDRLPLGARPDGEYRDAEVDLQPGDVVIFSSDGLVEAPSLPTAAAPPHLAPPERPGALFGFARLAASAAHRFSHSTAAEGIAAGIWSDLTAWCGEESHHDDVTLLVLRVSEAQG